MGVVTERDALWPFGAQLQQNSPLYPPLNQIHLGHISSQGYTTSAVILHVFQSILKDCNVFIYALT